jgi:predicted phage-related endonuclease
VPPPFTVEGEAGIMHRLYKWEEARATELDERTGACVARLHQLSAEKSALSRQVSAIDKQQKMLKGEIQGAMKGAGLGRYRDYLVKVKTIAVGAKEAYDYNRVTVTRAKESA